MNVANDSVADAHASSRSCNAYHSSTTDYVAPSIKGSSTTPGKIQMERSQKTLMDRVLVTPLKKSGRSFRSANTVSRSKPLTPSLRQASQRISSAPIFAPYPKRNATFPRADENSPPKTPTRNRLRRTHSERSYFSPGSINLAGEHILGSRRTQNIDTAAPKCFSRQSKCSSSTTSSSANPALFFNHWKNPRDIPDYGLNVDGRRNMDLEFNFQTMCIEDNSPLLVKVSKEAGYTCSTASKQLLQQPSSISHDPEHHCSSSDLLVTRLHNALANEIQARQLAEQRHLQEKKRRLEMEELVLHLQHERERHYKELSMTPLPQPPSSSPMLLSSPCPT